jgi:hypothetical protein
LRSALSARVIALDVAVNSNAKFCHAPSGAVQMETHGGVRALDFDHVRVVRRRREFDEGRPQTVTLVVIDRADVPFQSAVVQMQRPRAAVEIVLGHQLHGPPSTGPAAAALGHTGASHASDRVDAEQSQDGAAVCVSWRSSALLGKLRWADGSKSVQVNSRNLPKGTRCIEDARRDDDVIVVDSDQVKKNGAGIPTLLIGV